MNLCLAPHDYSLGSTKEIENKKELAKTDDTSATRHINLPIKKNAINYGLVESADMPNRFTKQTFDSFCGCRFLIFKQSLVELY